MIIAIDVHYRKEEAKIVGVLFQNWEDENATQVRETFKTDIVAYESGAFYKRELPCILQILNEIDLQNIEIIVIDGYVFLDDFQKAGLGFRVFEALEGKIAVIGVAKTSFFRKQNPRPTRLERRQRKTTFCNGHRHRFGHGSATYSENVWRVQNAQTAARIG